MVGWKRAKDVESISADQRIYFISDLHLGDGTPTDIFFGKDRHLIALVRAVAREGAVLVVAGDAMDFHQAWTFTRILRAHHDLLSEMSDLARAGQLIYLVGNHDYDLSLYRTILHFRVCDELQIGDRILVTHGYEYDPFIGNNIEGSHVATKIHHVIERTLNTWIRVPLGEFYTLSNRLTYWGIHKLAVMGWLWSRMWGLLGFPEVLRGHFEHLHYWTRTELGDPMCMFYPIMQRLEQDRWQYLVCGHSHMPGIVSQGDRRFVNTGSWTYGSAQYALWDGDNFTCRDWISGREFADQLYLPVIEGDIDERDFWKWWNESYMGWLKFRQGEERRGHLRGWEIYVRDEHRLRTRSGHVKL